MNCIFCQIAEKTLPATLVYEDDLVVAFKDITPQAPQHVLIIPRQHIATLNDLTADTKELVGHMAFIAKTIAHQLEIAETGYRLLMNCNEHGGQTVFHIHMHLMGGRALHWPPG